MKQILQDMASGDSNIVEAPVPKLTSGHLLINTTTSLISAGTERMLVGFGKANLIQKAQQQPEKVKMVLEKVQTDGLMTTVDAVRSKLGEPLPLGYCNVGVVHAVGSGVTGFSKGQRVVSNGGHADVVRIPRNLCAAIPDNVSDEEATFTVVASIGLQGIRLAKPTLGETFVVTGVGLIGLLTVQLLVANGCRVLAVDFDERKLALAKSFGAETCNPAKGEDPVAVGMSYSRGQGVDGVIITASTKESSPVTQAALMSRKRGRIILVGVTGLELNRADFYEKELSFQVSCSYGPGRYDAEYEDKGNDYPLGFVRWTEQRNFGAVLDMMSSGKLDVKPLITHHFDFDDAKQAYELLTSDKTALGILLHYKHNIETRHNKHLQLQGSSDSVELTGAAPTIGFIGAGNYASRMLIPAFKAAGVTLHTIATSGGVNGVVHGNKKGFAKTTTDTDSMLKDSAINTVAIVTRHNSHARFVSAALEEGKNVFVEKPLALTLDELKNIKTSYESAVTTNPDIKLMVGFNRRFSPHVQKMKTLLDTVKEPKSFIMTMNAGDIPSDHWTQDIDVGGGRIIGEACHFIDLMRYLAGSEIVSFQCRKMGKNPSVSLTEDKAAITLAFADGSFGTIHYLANGSNSFPKERVEVFAAGKVLQLDNFLKLRAYGWSGFKKMKLWRQDKGQSNCAASFIEAIKQGKPSPIPVTELFEIAQITIEIAETLRAQP